METSKLKRIASAVMNAIEERQLERIAKEVLNDDGVEKANALLAVGEIEELREQLFIATGTCLRTKEITHERAREVYALLKVSPAKSEELHYKIDRHFREKEALVVWETKGEEYDPLDPKLPPPKDMYH